MKWICLNQHEPTTFRSITLVLVLTANGLIVRPYVRAFPKRPSGLFITVILDLTVNGLIVLENVSMGQAF